MEQDKNTRTVFLVAVTILLAMLFLYFSRRVLTPFFIAFALAYLLDPATDRLESWKLSRTLSVVVLMAGFFLLCLGAGLLLFPVLKLQAEHLASNLPGYIAVVQEWIQPLMGMAGGIEPERIQDILNKEFMKAGELPLKAVTSITAFLWESVTGLFNFILLLANLVIIPVAMFYLLRDYDAINEKLLNLVPSRYRDQALALVKEMDGVLAGFVRGQLMVGLIMAGLYSIGLF
ncbi:MAG: AI-2E family transporter, partial [Nitrospinae bacterium]|nr:AI-2E family transporter [Nitrospinota bacterium]